MFSMKEKDTWEQLKKAGVTKSIECEQKRVLSMSAILQIIKNLSEIQSGMFRIISKLESSIFW